MPKYLYWSLPLFSDTALLTLVIFKVIRALGASFVLLFGFDPCS